MASFIGSDFRKSIFAALRSSYVGFLGYFGSL